MKNLFITTVILLSFYIHSYSQHIDTSIYVIEEVDSIPDANETELFNRAKVYLANTFTDPKKAVVYEDKNSNKISVQAYKYYPRLMAFSPYGEVMLHCYVTASI